ncbi:hypothetical protein ACFC8N_47070, partial [Streptomyces sp. NPDC055966]|uniref:hypothetical protein n=1 Tax=Streptomyces sp. NPDC055966 TaxID=3345669 RepID=UPI0035DC2F97
MFHPSSWNTLNPTLADHNGSLRDAVVARIRAQRRRRPGRGGTGFGRANLDFLRKRVLLTP